MTDTENTGVAADELKQFVERIGMMTVSDMIAALDEGEAWRPIEGFPGYEVTALRALIRLRAKEPQEREEEEAMLELYKSALGMV